MKDTAEDAELLATAEGRVVQEDDAKREIEIGDQKMRLCQKSERIIQKYEKMKGVSAVVGEAVHQSERPFEVAARTHPNLDSAGQ